MIDKPLYIIIFMYASTLTLIAGQYVFADPFGITLRNADGAEIKANIINMTDIKRINQVTGAIATGNYTIVDVADAFVKAANVLFQLLVILTGTGIFNLLYLLGVPLVAIAPFVILYLILLGNFILVKIRGI